MNHTSVMFNAAQLAGSGGLSPLYVHKWLIATHAISQEHYISRKQLFFGNPPQPLALPENLPMDKIMSMEELSSHVSQLSCGYQNVVFQVNWDLPNNNDIAIADPTPPEGYEIIAFSAYLFEALCFIYGSAQSISITKVISPLGNNMGRSLAFKLTDSNNNVYCADLSGVYP